MPTIAYKVLPGLTDIPAYALEANHEIVKLAYEMAAKLKARHAPDDSTASLDDYVQVALIEMASSWYVVSHMIADSFGGMQMAQFRRQGETYTEWILDRLAFLIEQADVAQHFPKVQEPLQ